MHLLVDNPLLTLTLIMSLGLLLGRVKIFGFRLGVAAVLFVGLGFATVEPDLAIPSFAHMLGLALFVYTIGLESGHEFFANFRSKGIKLISFAVLAFIVITVATIGLLKLTGISGITGAGAFTGALTNTPAMAAVVDSLGEFFTDPAVLKEKESLPLVAYSLAYPIGVFGVILSIAVLNKVFKIDHAQEAEDAGLAPHELYHHRIRVDVEHLGSIRNVPRKYGLSIIVSRYERDGKTRIPGSGTRVRKGDILTIVGEEEELERAEKLLGTPLSNDLRPGSDNLKYRRMFVSNVDIVGIPLEKLQEHHHGMLITRIRRGDHDHIPEPDTMLQLGDRVRVVAPRSEMAHASRILGDSYRSLSDFNLLPLAMGLMLGVLLGLVQIPLPGGGSLALGSAGGPLVVALILGALGRTGKIVWQISYSANLTLRQLGITLFLAAIGTVAGSGFRTALADPKSLTIIGVGAIITISISLLVLLIGYLVLKMPFGTVIGALAGIQTNPAVLSYANDLTDNELPGTGYATVYPVAMIAKILAAQIVLMALM